MCANSRFRGRGRGHGRAIPPPPRPDPRDPASAEGLAGAAGLNAGGRARRRKAPEPQVRNEPSASSATPAITNSRARCGPGSPGMAGRRRVRNYDQNWGLNSTWPCAEWARAFGFFGFYCLGLLIIPISDEDSRLLPSYPVTRVGALRECLRGAEATRGGRDRVSGWLRDTSPSLPR